MTLERHGGESEDALQVDVYLESLLSARERRPASGPSNSLVDDLDAEERRAARLLARHLVRFHPSYRFEEALAGRLRSAALRLGTAAGADEASGVATAERARIVVQFPLVPGAGSDVPIHAAQPGRSDLIGGDQAARRRVLIGSAIASGVSLAGAALVAWRVASPPRSAFGRATRAAHRTRPGLRGRA